MKIALKRNGGRQWNEPLVARHSFSCGGQRCIILYCTVARCRKEVQGKLEIILWYGSCLPGSPLDQPLRAQRSTPSVSRAAAEILQLQAGVRAAVAHSLPRGGTCSCRMPTAGNVFLPPSSRVYVKTYQFLKQPLFFKKNYKILWDISASIYYTAEEHWPY